MSIHPNYAEAILDGTKLVEFRKRPLAADVTTVVVYSTAPVRRIVGEFQIRQTLVGDPRDLWERVGHVGGIEEHAYFAYYGQSAVAAGLTVAGPRRYRRPVALDELDWQPTAPQSYSYLDEHQLQVIRNGGSRPSTTARLWAVLTNWLAVGPSSAEVILVPAAAADRATPDVMPIAVGR